MIPYNLKQDEYKNHPMDGQYGVVTTNSIYVKYPVTIVDNHEEVVDGKYTRKPSLCLLHLSRDVRQYIRLKIFDEFLYISFSFNPSTYRMFKYNKTALSDQEIIEILHTVFYSLQPSLQSRSLVGTTSKRLEDDPNYYEGRYVLNDENEYTILKCRTTYKFFRGNKRYYPDWENPEDLLFEGEINFDIYPLSLESERLRSFIVTSVNQILDAESDDSISRYKEITSQLNTMIENSI